MRISPRPMVHARLAAAALGLAALGLAALGAVVVPGPAGAGNLSCQTVNGHTLCLHGAGSMRCTTVGDRTDCYLDAGRGDLPDTAGPRPIRPPVQPLVPDTPSPGDDVQVERGPDGLRVRVGDLEVRMP